MRTRTKLRIGAGLLLLAAGAMLVRPRTGERAVEVRVVRYGYDESALLAFTNRSRSPQSCTTRDGTLFYRDPEGRIEDPVFVPEFVLLAGSGTQLFVLPRSVPATVPVEYVPEPSRFRQSIEAALRKVGIYLVSTGSVATVDLPPR